MFCAAVMMSGTFSISTDEVFKPKHFISAAMSCLIWNAEMGLHDDFLPERQLVLHEAKGARRLTPPPSSPRWGAGVHGL